MRNGCSEADLLTLIGAAVRRKKQQHAGKAHNKLAYLLHQSGASIFQHGNFIAQHDC